MKIYQIIKTTIPILFTLLLVACGGGGSKNTTPKKEETKSVNAFSIQSSYPANGAKNVALDSKVKITFNKPIDEIDQESVTMGSFSLNDKASNSISGTFSFNGNFIIFTPYDDLMPDTVYILTINKNIKDKKGKSLGLSQEIRFETKAKDAPTTEKKGFKVTKTVPSDNSVGVSLNSKILVSFSEDIALSSISSYTIKLYDNANQEVDIKLESSNNRLTIQPKADLKPESLYRVELSKGIKDTKGNELEAYEFSFQTGKAKIVPLSFGIDVSKPNSLKGEAVSFEAKEVKGVAPFAYEWSSSLDGQLSTKERFKTSDLSVGSHRITLRVTDADNTKSESIDIGVTEKPNEKPTTPTNLRVSDETTSSLKLVWNASTDEDGEVVNYMVSYKKVSETDYSVEVPIGGRILEHILTGLEADTSYELKVRARDDKGAYSEAKTVIGKTKATATKPKPAPTPVRKSLLKKTGQTQSYTDYDDGYYQKGVAPDYTRDDSKEIVTDKVTGLQWQDNSEAKTVSKNWSDAKSYCEALTLGGHNDWRLPTIEELESMWIMGEMILR